MWEVSWPMATAFIGSIATISLTILKIVGPKGKHSSEDVFSRLKKMETEGAQILQDRLAKLEQDNAVQEIQIKDIKERLEDLGESGEKIQDLLIKLLTK